MPHSRETNALTTVLLANGKNGRRFLAVPVACPMCDSPNVEMLGHTAPRVGGRSIGGVLRCLDCHAEEVLAIHLEPFTKQRASLKEAISLGVADSSARAAIEHGSRRGYRQHKRLGDEDACDACLAAHNAYNQAARAKYAAAVGAEQVAS